MLVLDDIIQCTERDEYMYQEMLSHLALCSHAKPRNVRCPFASPLHSPAAHLQVLIIGGGDGGCVREALRHADVEKVVLCEIDKVLLARAPAPAPARPSAAGGRRGGAQVPAVDGVGARRPACHRTAHGRPAVPKGEQEHLRRLSPACRAIDSPTYLQVIITDSSDPIGPAESLFGRAYYELLRDCLTEHGVLASQGAFAFLNGA